jgi:site-specific DNA recombinase
MTRVAIYARFSSDLQRDRSIDDQIAVCRSYADRSGFEVVATFEDRAASGASIHGRPGLQYLMSQAREDRFDLVVAESMSRLGRDQGDRADIRKRLAFAGVKLATPSDGIVSSLTDGIRAVIDSQYLEDLKVSVRRGMAGVVRDGRHAGGRAYGYRPVPGRPGELAIQEDEAEVVRRIFASYVAGKTPRTIAGELNAEGVPPPRGRAWNASTINGSAARANGILQNELYAGRLVWNRVQMMKDPDTGRRVSRTNDRSMWQTNDVPHLAIVDPEVHAAAVNRKAERAGVRPHLQRRPKHLLSGLLKCGSCGAGMSTNGKDKSGRIRVRCSAASESNTCPDPKTFYLHTIEKAVVTGLEAELRAPAVLAEYVRTYHEERQRLARRSVTDRSRLERRLAQVRREHERVIDRLLEDDADTKMLGARSKALGMEEREIEATLAASPAAEPPIALHPKVLARYEDQIGRLAEVLSAGAHNGDGEASDAIRDLVSKVVINRDESRSGGVIVEIEGRLNALLGEAAYPNRVRGVWGEMVAEEGLEPPTRGL